MERRRPHKPTPLFYLLSLQRPGQPPAHEKMLRGVWVCGVFVALVMANTSAVHVGKLVWMGVGFGVARWIFTQETEETKQTKRLGSFASSPCYKTVRDLPAITAGQKADVLHVFRNLDVLSCEYVSITKEDGLLVVGKRGSGSMVKVTVPFYNRKIEWSMEHSEKRENGAVDHRGFVYNNGYTIR